MLDAGLPRDELELRVEAQIDVVTDLQTTTSSFSLRAGTTASPLRRVCGDTFSIGRTRNAICTGPKYVFCAISATPFSSDRWSRFTAGRSNRRSICCS
jgi:hypothetical protein